MRSCKRCGSHAINPENHGRDPLADLDLCDVCYWRAATEGLKARVGEMGEVIRWLYEEHADSFVRTPYDDIIDELYK